MIAALESLLDCSLLSTEVLVLRMEEERMVLFSRVVLRIEEFLSTSSRKDDWHSGQLYVRGVPPLPIAKTLPQATRRWRDREVRVKMRKMSKSKNRNAKHA